MKKLILVLMYLLITDLNYAQLIYESNWSTVGGNSNRTGYDENFFGSFSGFDKTFNAPGSLWGMPVFTYHMYFATTRYTSLNPLKALIAGYSFKGTSDPIWTYGANSGVNVIMGMNDNKVYVRDFQQNGYDTIFALDAENGSLLWKSGFTVERGIIWTAVFADNGDLIVPGSGAMRIMRINHNNGDTVWTNNRIIPNTGAETMCINGNTLYAWEGGLTTPKKIIAIDVNSGVKKYSSADLPGDGDQEIPFTVSKNGVVYCIRDGGLMYALKDNGIGFETLWSRSVMQPVGTYTQFAIGKDNSVYIPFGRKIYKLNHINGEALDSSVDLVSTGNINPRFAMGIFGELYVGNGASVPSEGKFFAFSNDLKTLTGEITFPYNYYSGPALGSSFTFPHILFTGAGTEIKAKYHFIDNVISLNTGIPENYYLKQNYPNPFNPTTSFEFGISESGSVSLKVYDVSGKESATLVNEILSPGKYKYQFSTINYPLPSGIYFYTFKSAEFIETKRMILLK
ncbi:MAG TPA: PQQ-binding-like beta-propeller repeat protein [Ignavibacteria bacterium]|nr:PQQ-binding-like beta-propeller repeat protein [Ignavibacteria bacterium]